MKQLKTRRRSEDIQQGTSINEVSPSKRNSSHHRNHQTLKEYQEHELPYSPKAGDLAKANEFSSTKSSSFKKFLLPMSNNISPQNSRTSNENLSNSNDRGVFSSLAKRIRGTKKYKGENVPPSFSGKSECHICKRKLRLRKFKHNCRNCGKSVCGNHSKNNAPLPHYGILKAVRICDICSAAEFEKRQFGAPSTTMEVDDEIIEEVVEEEEEESVGMFGVLMSCLVEQQDDTMDEFLYLGTFRMGSKSLASRNFNINIAFWKERYFVLTHVEILCFKRNDASDIGEVRTIVHMSDILHVEIHSQYLKILTIVLSDGRIFRIRTKTQEECKKIYQAVCNARQAFQDAMRSLQKDVTKNIKISMITTSLSSSSMCEEEEEKEKVKEKKNRIILMEEEEKEVIIKKEIDYKTKCYVSIVPNMMVHIYLFIDSTYQVVAHLNYDDLLTCGMEGDFRINTKPITMKNNSIEYQIDVEGKMMPFTFSFMDINICIILLLFLLYSWFMKYFFISFIVWNINMIILFLYFSSWIQWTWKTIWKDSFNLKSIALPKNICFHISKIRCIHRSDDENELNLEEYDFKDVEIDARFIEGCRGDLIEARKRYKATLKWRKENLIDNILHTPHIHFEDMKECFLNYIHKQDKHGHLISIEHGGNLKKNLQDFLSRGISIEEAIRHHIFVTEFTWKILDPRPYPNGQFLKIIDIKGISFSDMGGDVVSFMKRAGSAIGDNNPERLWKVFIINPPSWFNILWKLVAPLVNPKTRDKTNVVRGQKEIAKALLEHISPENLPVEYGGTCQCGLLNNCTTESPQEIQLRNYVKELNLGKDMRKNE